jgi:hypothetical protein
MKNKDMVVTGEAIYLGSGRLIPCNYLISVCKIESLLKTVL